MIRHALALETERAKPRRARWDRRLGHRFERLRVSQGVGDRAVAGNASGEPSAVEELQRLEALLDAFVDVTQAFLESEHLLADDLKPEMPRLDDAGVHGTDGNLVHAVARDA